MNIHYLFVILSCFYIVKSQILFYKIDTINIPTKVLKTKCPLAKSRVCYDNGVCSYVNSQYVSIKEDKLFIYSICNSGEKNEVKFEFKCYNILEDNLAILFDTVLSRPYYPGIRYNPFFISNGVVILVGDNLIVYDYRRGRLWDYWYEYYNKHGNLKKAISYQYYYTYNMQPLVNENSLFLSPVPTSNYKELKKTHELYKKYKSVLKYEYKEVGDSFVFGAIDTLCYFPRVCKKVKWYPTFLPIVWVDTLSHNEIYILRYGANKIEVYDSIGKIMRYLPRMYNNEKFPATFFMVNSDYLLLVWTNPNKSRQFLRVINKISGAEIANLKWNKTLRSIVSNYEIAGYGDNGGSLFFILNRAYRDLEHNKFISVLRINFYVQ